MNKIARLILSFAIGCALLYPEAEAQTNLIQNGDFSAEFTGWTKTASGNPANLKIATASNCGSFHTTPAAAFDAFNNQLLGLEQSVVLPGSAPATLSFKVWGQYDPTTMRVKLLFNGAPTVTLDSFVASKLIQSVATTPFTCSGATFETKQYDLTSYAGQAFTLRFEATSSGFNGTFAVIDDIVLASDSGSPTPTPPGTSGKRATSTQIFCNRTGPQLATAKCSATVADLGAPPRLQPTGVVAWEALEGFFPSAAQCAPIQVPLSPGIAACDVEFAIPDGFPIGVKFPINASYNGDDNFDPSSTSHKLIVAACVGSTSACPSSIGLSFEEYPALLKDRLEALISCGGGATTSTTRNLHLARAGDEKGKGGDCSVKGLLQIDPGKVFGFLPFEDAVQIGDQISDADANKDTMLYLLKHARDVENAERWKKIQENQRAIEALSEDILKNRTSVRKDSKPFQKYSDFIRQDLPLAGANGDKKRKKFDPSFKSKIVEKKIKSDKIGTVTFALSKRAKTLSSYFKKAGVATIPVTLSITVKQKKRRGSAKIVESINAVVR